LKGDPAIRWQVMDNLLESKSSEIVRERSRTANEGWGARLLAQQDASGLFGGGLYSPKWISTTYTLLLLRRIGIPPETSQLKLSCQLLLEKGFYKDGGINYFKSMNCSETCVTAMILSILSYFQYPDKRISKLVGYLLEEQLPDGGWNCEKYRGATHSSFHTTISALEGLYEFRSIYDNHLEQIEKAQNRAIEFLLEHRLYRSHQTGKIFDPKMTRLSFPPRWKYDILRALDYFQAARIPYDARMKDALDLLNRKKMKDNRWPLQQRYSGRTYFEMEKVGKPSRWNTLRALRVMKWYGEHI
jgi:hypothetical protein